MKECPKCKDSGWICEKHPNKPHEHKIMFGEERFVDECHGAGMPCKCNTYSPPWNYPDKTRIEVRND